MNTLIFLEGPAYAGKTTYLNAMLLPRSQKIVEASEYLGGDHNFPEPPYDVASMLYCTYFFSYMENKRLGTVMKSTQANDTLFVADRFTPFSSMLFYHLRYITGAIPRKEYQLGIMLSSHLFIKNLSFADEDWQFSFLLFDISRKDLFTDRTARGTRNAEFNTWRNFRLQSRLYAKHLGQYASCIVDGKGQAKQNYYLKKELSKLLDYSHFTLSHHLRGLTGDEKDALIQSYLPVLTRQAIERRVYALLA